MKMTVVVVVVVFFQSVSTSLVQSCGFVRFGQHYSSET